MSIQSLLNTDVRAEAGTVNLTKGVLAIQTASSAAFKSTNAYTYAINGVLLAKAALATQSFAVTNCFDGKAVTDVKGIAAFVQPISSTVIYLIGLDASGTVYVTQGTYAGQAIVYPNDVARAPTGTGAIPFEPTNAATATIGAIKVTTNGSTTFTPGTTALDAAGLTVVYTDLLQAPINGTL